MSYTFTPKKTTPFTVQGAFGGLIKEHCSCYKVKDSTIYLDAGAIGKIGTEQNKIFLLTHSHVDHIGGLLCYLKDYPNEKVTIYSDLTIRNLTDLTGINEFPNTKIIKPGSCKIVEPCKIGGYSVTAMPLVHGSYDGVSYVYILDGNSAKDSIVYFGDFDMDSPDAISKFDQAIQTIPANRKVHVLMECAIPDCNKKNKNCYGHINKTLYAQNTEKIKAGNPKAVFYVTHRKPSFKIIYNQIKIEIPRPLDDLTNAVQITYSKNFSLKGWSFANKKVKTGEYDISTLEGIIDLLVQIPPLVKMAYGGNKVEFHIKSTKTNFEGMINEWCNGKYWPKWLFILTHPNFKFVLINGSQKKYYKYKNGKQIKQKMKQ